MKFEWKEELHGEAWCTGTPASRPCLPGASLPVSASESPAGFKPSIGHEGLEGEDGTGLLQGWVLAWTTGPPQAHHALPPHSLVISHSTHTYWASVSQALCWA